MTGLYSVPQTDPPRSPRETLPTMYDHRQLTDLRERLRQRGLDPDTL
uniref:Uncharacterized protein n=1 Tax=Cyanothece sp. (strain PCC 7425 / ATCC 29141) TaxID=395961 RepID=B8HU68_CYAP4